MRVFVTGASGFIGSAVVAELRSAGHQVLGLSRSEVSARAIVAAGAEAHHGALDDLERLAAGAARCDAVLHLAFDHDFSRFAESARAEARALDALCGALEGSGRPLVIASGTLGLAPGRVASEQDQIDFDAPASPRAAGVKIALAAVERGVRAVIVRLPPSVHGAGDHGFVARLVEIARQRGVCAYVGDGSSRWPAVHRRDAAALFRLAMEHAPAGATLHAVDDEAVAQHDIAAAIAEGLRLPLVSIAPEQAADHFGWLAPWLALDSPASSAITQQQLAWHPDGPKLLADLAAGHYFAT
ncbi:MAG: SDR family oxidoreductase [Myxococcales bacterium]|nr:SDR family oxidoreductase [Myxococcales bacterium]